MTTKRRILFVDDEASVLEGLKNVFHRDRARWDMIFARGPEVALIALKEHIFDVVVSDMRMPGIDGATLLSKVRELSPRTGRIMLSGSAEQDELDRALASVDELLGKPCDTKTLRAAIERWMPKE